MTVYITPLLGGSKERPDEPACEEKRSMKKGIQVDMAILDEMSWETARITIPNKKIVQALGYDKLNELGRNEVYADEEFDHAVGVYLFDELVEFNLKDNTEKIWGILETVNEHFGEEMSDILDEDFDELLRELANG